MIINKDEITEEILHKIKSGAVFICPTDTIYGLSCDARNSESVAKIRTLKGRTTAPFSIWVPSKEWITLNCEVEEDTDILEQLPGPYTLVLPLLTDSISAEVNPGLKTIGVRIPNHWFSEIVTKLGFPLITTSVNKAGQEHMTSLENADTEILNAVNFVIYEGKKSGRASTIIEKGKEKKR